AKVLSGGERNRLALCKLLLSPFNVLIMDEPTNHLDIQSKNVLKEALKKYAGTLIIVSHDRDFLQGLTDSVYGFKDKEIKEYLGDIDYFLDQHKLENLREAEKRTVVVEKKVSKKEDYKLSRQEEKELKQLKNKLSKAERAISDTEKEILDMDAKLADDYEKTAADPKFFENYQAKKDSLDDLMEAWAELDEKVNSFSA
ncbi:MAG: ATP-binding cassette domain-containing protein, partial [Flavicella sp.]|nr:ATP-binding cassette domain-containing protein [Flavicella sp.]